MNIGSEMLYKDYQSLLIVIGLKYRLNLIAL
jgi:hypothetical protein